MTSHRIIAQPWQLKSAAEGTLGAIVLPLVPEPKWNEVLQYWSWVVPSKPEWTIEWRININPYIFNILPYQLGDRIYLAEEWFEHDDGFAIRSLWKSDKNTYFDDSEWQSAQNMPPEAAQYWYEIQGVRVKQMSYFNHDEVIGAGITSGDIFDGSDGAWERFWDLAKRNWNAAHPDYLWDLDRWVIVLDLNIFGGLDGTRA